MEKGKKWEKEEVCGGVKINRKKNLSAVISVIHNLP